MAQPGGRAMKPPHAGRAGTWGPRMETDPCPSPIKCRVSRPGTQLSRGNNPEGSQRASQQLGWALHGQQVQQAEGWKGPAHAEYKTRNPEGPAQPRVTYRCGGPTMHLRGRQRCQGQWPMDKRATGLGFSLQHVSGAPTNVPKCPNGHPTARREDTGSCLVMWAGHPAAAP